MKRTWILAGCYAGGGAIALWLASATPTHAQGEEIPEKLQAKFRQLDTNKDGALQESELPAAQRALFGPADTNKDGKLSVREAIRLYVREQARKRRGKNDPALKVRQKFDQADTNKDGVVVKAEFTAPEMLFTKFDRDGDGKVTFPEALAFAVEEEIAKVFEKHDGDMSGTLTTAEVPDDAKLLVLAADLNEDGQVTGKEAFDFVYAARLLAAKAGPATGAPPPSSAAQADPKAGVLGALAAGFKALDANRDGKLTGGEWPGSLELRRRFDVDGDGAVDPAEVSLRAAFAKRLAARGAGLKPRATALGKGAALAVVGLEVKGLFAAGRYEEASRLLDQIELKLARAEAAKKQ